MSVTANTRARTDDEAILAAALDYVQGWFDGDAERMERCLHPRLAKRVVDRDADSGEWTLREMGKEEMVRWTSEGGGKGQGGRYETTILDRTGNAASVKVVSPPFVDYVHLGRFGAEWLVVNVLYERRTTA